MADICIGVGHRGFPYRYPANTLQGFAAAAALGCTMVECDVRQAADGLLVLAHDPLVKDKEGRSYPIAHCTAEALGQLDLGAGEGVPTLEELVEWAQGRVSVMADMKCEGGDVEERVVQALAPLPAAEKIVAGAGKASRRRFRQLAPDLSLSLTLSRREESMLPPAKGLVSWMASLDVQAVTWEHPLLTEERLWALRACGLPVYAWTINEERLMLQFKERVDGIISDRADLLHALGIAPT